MSNLNESYRISVPFVIKKNELDLPWGDFDVFLKVKEQKGVTTSSMYDVPMEGQLCNYSQQASANV